MFQRQLLVRPVTPHTRIHNVIDWFFLNTNTDIDITAFDTHVYISISTTAQDQTVDTEPMAIITAVRHRPRRAPPQR